ncbi:hypothetical protein BDV37DRAFT_13332 [Aspergillus pseudonomiae]|uniref:Uncharacterized protein n=1 Tax=Aspergillus pseudonomiae TaxID=1506151 RepID=A0A5N7CXS5_9EURO|nr:uncharacterized protein BDV37DRAFT_13332 [Aspergillus pseudonomiae]KAE8398990.1 hypothetical protein BDV37DRAFT_13332 [Aspergillus pseudonomiae]
MVSPCFAVFAALGKVLPIVFRFFCAGFSLRIAPNRRGIPHLVPHTRTQSTRRQLKKKPPKNTPSTDYCSSHTSQSIHRDRHTNPIQANDDRVDQQMLIINLP